MKWWIALGGLVLVGLVFTAGYVPNRARPVSAPQEIERGECRDWAIDTWFYENAGCPDSRQRLEIGGGWIRCMCQRGGK